MVFEKEMSGNSGRKENMIVVAPSVSSTVGGIKNGIGSGQNLGGNYSKKTNFENNVRVSPAAKASSNSASAGIRRASPSAGQRAPSGVNIDKSF